ncbi:MAG TPA: MarR family transcriptional regulator, partial [Actinomycetota bacterium]|nr:MarR family transcriptional regulator [Actinomycetota bacterium]
MTSPEGRQDEPAQGGRRAELLEELALAGRAMSAATVMFHATVAALQGLSATEEKALDLLERFGP